MLDIDTKKSYNIKKNMEYLHDQGYGSLGSDTVNNLTVNQLVVG